MAGLIQSQMNPQQAASTLASPPDESGLPEAQPQDEQYEKYKMAGQKLLYNEKSAKALLDGIKAGASNPAKAVANAAFTVMVGLDQKAGGQIPEEDLVSLAMDMLDEIVKLVADTGIMKISDKILPKAAQELVAIAIENGVLDPSDVEQMMQEMAPEELQALVAEQQKIAESVMGEEA